MGWLQERKERRIEKAKEMSEEAKDAMNSVESPYVDANAMLSQYEQAVKFKPGSAYRYAKKAYRSAVEESEAAKIHVKASDLLENQDKSDERQVEKMEQAYLSSTASGNHRKALKTANEMLRVANSSPDPCPVSIRVDFDGLAEGSIRIVVTNKGKAPLVINSVSASSGSAALDLGASMSESLQSNASLTRDVTIDPDASQEVSVMVEYEAGYDTRQVRKHFPILRGV